MQKYLNSRYLSALTNEDLYEVQWTEAFADVFKIYDNMRRDIIDILESENNKYTVHFYYDSHFKINKGLIEKICRKCRNVIISGDKNSVFDGAVEVFKSGSVENLLLSNVNDQTIENFMSQKYTLKTLTIKSEGSDISFFKAAPQLKVKDKISVFNQEAFEYVIKYYKNFSQIHEFTLIFHEDMYKKNLKSLITDLYVFEFLKTVTISTDGEMEDMTDYIKRYDNINLFAHTFSKKFDLTKIKCKHLGITNNSMIAYEKIDVDVSNKYVSSLQIGVDHIDYNTLKKLKGCKNIKKLTFFNTFGKSDFLTKSTEVFNNQNIFEICRELQSLEEVHIEIYTKRGLPTYDKEKDSEYFLSENFSNYGENENDLELLMNSIKLVNDLRSINCKIKITTFNQYDKEQKLFKIFDTYNKSIMTKEQKMVLVESLQEYIKNGILIVDDDFVELLKNVENDLLYQFMDDNEVKYISIETSNLDPSLLKIAKKYNIKQSSISKVPYDNLKILESMGTIFVENYNVIKNIINSDLVLKGIHIHDSMTDTKENSELKVSDKLIIKKELYFDNPKYLKKFEKKNIQDISNLTISSEELESTDQIINFLDMVRSLEYFALSGHFINSSKYSINDIIRKADGQNIEKEELNGFGNLQELGLGLVNQSDIVDINAVNKLSRLKKLVIKDMVGFNRGFWRPTIYKLDSGNNQVEYFTYNAKNLKYKNIQNLKIIQSKHLETLNIGVLDEVNEETKEDYQKIFKEISENKNLKKIEIVCFSKGIYKNEFKELFEMLDINIVKIITIKGEDLTTSHLQRWGFDVKKKRKLEKEEEEKNKKIKIDGLVLLKYMERWFLAKILSHEGNTYEVKAYGKVEGTYIDYYDKNNIKVQKIDGDIIVIDANDELELNKRGLYIESEFIRDGAIVIAKIRDKWIKGTVIDNGDESIDDIYTISHEYDYVDGKFVPHEGDDTIQTKKLVMHEYDLLYLYRTGFKIE